MAGLWAPKANPQLNLVVREVCEGGQLANKFPSQSPGEGREGINPLPGKKLPKTWDLHALRHKASAD